MTTTLFHLALPVDDLDAADNAGGGFIDAMADLNAERAELWSKVTTAIPGRGRYSLT